MPFQWEPGKFPEHLSASENRRIKTAHSFILFATILNIVFFLNDVFIGQDPLIIGIDIVVTIEFVFLLWLLRSPKHQQLSIDIYLNTINLWLFFNASYYSKEAGIQYFYFASIVTCYALIKPTNRFRLFFYPITNILAIVLLETGSYSLFTNYNLPKSVITDTYYLSLASSFVIIILFTRYIVKVASENETRLEHDKDKLLELNLKLNELNDQVKAHNVLLKDEIYLKSKELLIQQKDFNKNLIAAEEKERKRLSKELHDGLGLLLSIIKLKIEAINEHDVILQEVSQLIDKACIELRLISQNLTPHMLDEIGVLTLIEDLMNNINKTGLYNIDLDSRGWDGTISDKVKESQIYRMILELINNSIKHSEGKNISLSLEHKTNHFHISIKDDGIGLPKSFFIPGHGLINIRDTVESYSGEFHFDSEKNNGTAIKLTIPL